MFSEYKNRDDGPDETIKEQNGSWWWADEVWEWHGPCSSKELAQKRQSLYAADLMGVNQE